MDMSDRELRNQVLRAHYARRKEGYLTLSDKERPPSCSKEELSRLCLQLQDLGLLAILFSAAQPPSVAVAARMTAAGVDLVESERWLEAGVCPAKPSRLPKRPGWTHWLEEWQSIVLSLVLSALFVGILKTIGVYFFGQHFDLKSFFEMFGNLTVLVGVILTAMGTHLSRAEVSSLASVEEGSARLEPALVAKALRLASRYAAIGLVCLLFGGAALACESFMTTVENFDKAVKAKL